MNIKYTIQKKKGQESKIYTIKNELSQAPLPVLRILHTHPGLELPLVI